MSRREDFARLADGDVALRDASMSELGEVATALRTLGRAVDTLEPDPAFRAALRQQLVAVATVQAAEPEVSGMLPAGSPSRVAGRRTPNGAHRSAPRGRRAIAALAGTVAVVIGVGGVAVAASRSLPGSPFYDVKRATESVQLWTAQGQLDKGRRHLEFAATRLDEAQRLSPSSSHLPSTLNAMDAQTRDGANDLVAAAHSSQSTAPLMELQTFAHRQYAGLQQLMSTAPPLLRLREIRSATLVEVINAQAATLAGDCTGCAGASPNGGGLGGLLNGSVPSPGVRRSSGSGSRHHQSSGNRHHGNGARPRPTTGAGVPTPGASPPVKVPIPIHHPSGLPTLPSTLKSLLPTSPTTLPTKLPSILPSLPTTLPTVRLPR